MRIISALVALLALGACASGRGQSASTVPDAEASSAERTHVGTVRVVGAAPVDVHVVLETLHDRHLRLAGPLREELGRLAGAELEVDGRSAAGRFHATGYRVRSVDGQPVVFGEVEAAPGGGLQLRTADGALVGLAGADGIRIGQKIWVQGQRTVQVQSYGVIRP